MQPPRQSSLINIAFVTTLAVIVALAVLSLEPTRTTNFNAYHPSAIATREDRLFTWRPADYMSPAGMRLPAPHPLAREADDLLLTGSTHLALQVYERAAREHPSDLYSSFVAGCLCAELGLIDRGLEHAERVLRYGALLRSAHLLRDYLEERRVSHRRPETAYLLALAKLARNPTFVVFPNVDPLHDRVEERLLTAPSPRPPRSLGDPDLQTVLDLSGPAPSLARARQVLERDGTVPLYLLAMTVLYPRARVTDLPLLEDVLGLLSSQEPDNSYYDFLVAALRSPELLHPVHQFEEMAPWMTRGSIEALLEASQKPRFDPHVREVYLLCAEARRQSGQVFPELHVPPAPGLTFLGDTFFPRRLANTALAGPFRASTPESQALMYGSLALLSHWPATCPDPFGGEPVTEYYGPLFLDHPATEGIDLEAIVTLVRNLPPSPVVPPRVLLLQRYTLFPLPVPGLVQAFLSRYAGQPDLLVRELAHALEQV